MYAVMTQYISPDRVICYAAISYVAMMSQDEFERRSKGIISKNKMLGLEF